MCYFLRLLTSWKSWSWDTLLLFTTPFCLACVLTLRTDFSSYSVTVYMPYRALKMASIETVKKVCSVLRAIQITFHFSRCAFVKVLNVTEHFIYIYITLQKLLLFIYSWWHYIKVSKTLSSMTSSMTSNSEIQVQGRPPSCCTLKFTACFHVSHST
jgi:hypothetical protein